MHRSCDFYKARWASKGASPSIAAPIGVAEAGELVLDMVGDGPHGLMAGTTGSGKSELLRSYVGALACEVGPDHPTQP